MRTVSRAVFQKKTQIMLLISLVLFVSSTVAVGFVGGLIDQRYSSTFSKRIVVLDSIISKINTSDGASFCIVVVRFIKLYCTGRKK